jgi:hypothetical protein
MAMTTWTPTSSARFYEMLGVLPPAAMSALGFLVGEPFDHRACSIRKTIKPTFMAFAEIEGRFFEASKPLTVAEFCAATEADVLAAVAAEPAPKVAA